MTSTFLGFLLLVVPISSPSSLERGDQEFARIRYPLAEALYEIGTSHLAGRSTWQYCHVRGW